jgi:prepilin-type N-terminal cleavage/methylation domain-containing protein
MRKVLKAMRSQKGFTLIELLVVIGILAALAGVVTLAVQNFIGKGVCQACLTEQHNVQTAVVAYMADNEGHVPGTGDIGGYFIGDTNYTWEWDTDGKVTSTCADLTEESDCVPST